jgi:hypothetical protein
MAFQSYRGFPHTVLFAEIIRWHTSYAARLSSLSNKNTAAGSTSLLS